MSPPTRPAAPAVVRQQAPAPASALARESIPVLETRTNGSNDHEAAEDPFVNIREAEYKPPCACSVASRPEKPQPAPVSSPRPAPVPTPASLPPVVTEQPSIVANVPPTSSNVAVHPFDLSAATYEPPHEPNFVSKVTNRRSRAKPVVPAAVAPVQTPDIASTVYQRSMKFPCVTVSREEIFSIVPQA